MSSDKVSRNKAEWCDILERDIYQMWGMQHQITGVDPGSYAVWRFLKYDGELLLGFGGIDKFHITWDTLLIHLFRTITEVQRYICFVYGIYLCSLLVEFICVRCPWNLSIFIVRGIYLFSLSVELLEEF